mgnify:CR=1 FL=1
MRIIYTDTYQNMSKEAAKILAGQLWVKPDSVLGLATGSTPVELYQNLVWLHEAVGLDFSEATSFNLDEYVGLPEDDPQSYHRFMHENLFDHVNIRKDHIFFPNGTGKDFSHVRAPRLTLAEDGVPKYSFHLDALRREKTVNAAEIYRHRGAWKLKLVGAGYEAGLARLCEDYGLSVE